WALAAQTLLVEEFLGARHDEHDTPRFRSASSTALLHGHCHQKAIFGTAGAMAALRLVPGWTVEEIPSGCCGMAGSFGYEKEHYDLSLQIGELSLFPAVRAAGADTCLLAAGTSCRHQIADATGKTAVHPVVAMAAALDD